MRGKSIHKACWLVGACAFAFGCGDDADAAKAATDGNPSKTGTKVSFLGPAFGGAGTAGAGQSIAAGVDTVTCGGVGAAPGGSTGPDPSAVSHAQCFFSPTDPVPAAFVEWIVESAQNVEVVHVRLTLNPSFVDNTYGLNAIGWGAAMAAPGGKPKPMGMKGGKGKSGHTFKDLVGSDHAEFKLSDAAGNLSLHFKLDYISESPTAPSGYATLGVTGGEGKMLVGDAASIVAASTSLDRDLNACNLGQYTTDSPATDDDYTPNAAASAWDYRVVYDVWVKQDAFGSAGFGSALVDFVHASPSKLGENTVDVIPGDCPPEWPPYCATPEGCDHCGTVPDQWCDSEEPPPCDPADPLCGDTDIPI
jgi:hypothetical protein